MATRGRHIAHTSLRLYLSLRMWQIHSVNIHLFMTMIVFEIQYGERENVSIVHVVTDQSQYLVLVVRPFSDHDYMWSYRLQRLSQNHF
jgi:hypothetical protein